jgi:hypothetical protein
MKNLFIKIGKVLIYATALLVVLLLLAWGWLIFFSGAWFYDQMQPKHTFESGLGRGHYRDALDYTDEKYWAAFPGKASEAVLVPEGLEPSPTRPLVDVFYIHPTSYVYGDHWNAPPFTDSWSNDAVKVMLAAQAGMFNGCCRVFAPRYRDATIWSFYGRNPEAFEALDFAYQDIKQAFSYYLKHHNKGRPFIIAGHSQGTALGVRLLKEEIQGRELQQRLVAVYAGGYWLPMDTFERTLTDIQPCSHATETGCLVHWSTYGMSGERKRFVPHWYKSGWEWADDSKAVLCVNPLSWQIDGGKVAADQHLGALTIVNKSTAVHILFNLPNGHVIDKLDSPVAEWTSAQCKQGLLYIEDQLDGAFVDDGFNPNHNYHNFDFHLFYMNVRVNVQQRINAFLKASENG